MSLDYELLKNRMSNGKPFVKEQALKRISALADNFTITQEQANELAALAESKGLDTPPVDLSLEERVQSLEEAVLALMGGMMNV